MKLYAKSRSTAIAKLVKKYELLTDIDLQKLLIIHYNVCYIFLPLNSKAVRFICTYLKPNHNAQKLKPMTQFISVTKSPIKTPTIQYDHVVTFEIEHVGSPRKRPRNVNSSLRHQTIPLSDPEDSYPTESVWCGFDSMTRDTRSGATVAL